MNNFSLQVIGLALTVFSGAFVTNAFSFTVTFNDGTQVDGKSFDKDSAHKVIRYGSLSMQYSDKPIQNIQLPENVTDKLVNNLGLNGIAHAGEDLSDEASKQYLAIRRHIKDAWVLSDIEPYVSQEFYAELKARVDHGVKEYVVLAMLNAMLPSVPSVQHVDVGDGQAFLLVRSQELNADSYGVITMVRNEQKWILHEEQWYGYLNPKVDQAMQMSVTSPWDSVNNPVQKLSYVWPTMTEHNANLLDLHDYDVPISKRSLAFLYFIGPKKKVTYEFPEDKLVPRPIGDNSDMHLVWTATHRVVSKQKLLTDNDSVDVSIAHVDEGYKPGVFNVQIPRRSPKEVLVGVLCQF